MVQTEQKKERGPIKRECEYYKLRGEQSEVKSDPCLGIDTGMKGALLSKRQPRVPR